MKALKNLFFGFILSVLFPLLLTAQHHDKGKMENHKSHKSQQMEQYNASSDFKDQLKSVFQAYIGLKEALVASDASRASTKAKLVATQLRKVDGTALDSDAKQAWEKWSGNLGSKLAQIQSAKDINTQRKAFAPVSNALYYAVQSFGVKGLDAYYQFCPMAHNGQGAHWMSEDKAIRNPYYGSKMMKCGKTVEEL